MSTSNFSPVVQNDLAAAIASGQSVSATIDLAGTELCGLYIPSAFTGTSLKIQASPDGVAAFQTVQSAGADYSLTVAPSKYVPVENLAVLAGVRFVQLVSGSAEAAARSISLATRPV